MKLPKGDGFFIRDMVGWGFEPFALAGSNPMAEGGLLKKTAPPQKI